MSWSERGDTASTPSPGVFGCYSPLSCYALIRSQAPFDVALEQSIFLIIFLKTVISPWFKLTHFLVSGTGFMRSPTRRLALTSDNQTSESQIRSPPASASRPADKQGAEQSPADPASGLRRVGYLAADSDLSVIICPGTAAARGTTQGGEKTTRWVYSWIIEEHWASCQYVQFHPRMKHSVLLTWLSNHIT